MRLFLLFFFVFPLSSFASTREIVVPMAHLSRWFDNTGESFSIECTIVNSQSVSQEIEISGVNVSSASANTVVSKSADLTSVSFTLDKDESYTYSYVASANASAPYPMYLKFSVTDSVSGNG